MKTYEEVLEKLRGLSPARSLSLPSATSAGSRLRPCLLGEVPSRGVQVDQIAEILARRFGIPMIPKWRHVLDGEYAHALQILSQAEFVYDAGRSSWLQHQDSFNDRLTRSFIDFLANRGLPGARPTVGGGRLFR